MSSLWPLQRVTSVDGNIQQLRSTYSKSESFPEGWARARLSHHLVPFPGEEDCEERAAPSGKWGWSLPWSPPLASAGRPGVSSEAVDLYFLIFYYFFFCVALLYCMILNLPLEIFFLPHFPPLIKRNRYILFCLLMAVFSLSIYDLYRSRVNTI